MNRARILVVDSGLGGLSVAHAIRRQCPSLSMVYCADYAAFPYGDWSQDDLQSHLMDQVSVWIRDCRPDAVVIACNTASTLVLPGLRAVFDMPVVGTVPAIKPAAAITRTNMVSVLATPGTVTRDYTHGLLREFASTVDVALIGSPNLASLVEQWFLDGASPQLEAAIGEQLAPCFRQNPQGMKTDSVVLACTHFPLLKTVFRQIAPWPVHWLDPSAAIARQAAKVLGSKYDAAGIGTFEIISSQPGHEGRVETVWQKLSTQPASGLTEQN